MKENVVKITDDLNLGDAFGVFVCNYEVFKRFYQLQKRRSRRDGSVGYIVLMSLTLEDKVPMEAAMDCVEQMLVEAFREEDVACRYSESQFLMIFPNCDGDILKILNQRIGYRLSQKPEWKDVLSLEYSISLISD